LFKVSRADDRLGTADDNEAMDGESGKFPFGKPAFRLYFMALHLYKGIGKTGFGSILCTNEPVKQGSKKNVPAIWAVFPAKTAFFRRKAAHKQ
jgi:hypothetical protein